MSNSSTAEYLSRRERNLAFFRKHHPSLHAFFADYQMNRSKLNILTDQHEVDIIGEQGSFYANAAHAHAAREVASFKSVFAPGKPLQTVAPITAEGFIHPRFMHRQLKSLVEPYQSHLSLDNYVIDFYPLLVFMGVGAGIQIELMSQSEKIQHLIIAEADPDLFAASLYVVEWSDIARPFINGDGARSIRFIIGLSGNVNDIYADIWNSIIGMCPVYPAGTMFFIHRGDRDYSQLADRLNENMMWYLSSWGNYDDEIRQLNNALHTFHMQVPMLPSRLSGGLEVPVFIVGNGPSLDDYVDAIRQCKGRALVVSCGTALRSLVKYGIEPDVHVELESDFLSYSVLADLDRDILKRLRFISPTHICPLAHLLFSESRIYFKKENCVSEFFAGDNLVVERGVPTCVNAAFALFLSFGFEQIYLIGTDFGYRDKQYHHAKTSIYQAEDKGALEDKVGFEADGNMQVRDWNGNWIYTNHIYYSTLKMIERVAQEVMGKNRKVRIFACTHGARIEGAERVDEAALVEMVGRLPASTAEVMDQLFSVECQPFSLVAVDNQVAQTAFRLEEACRNLLKILDGANVNSLWQLSLCCSRINAYLETQLRERSHSIYYLIRGTVWCWIYVGLTYRWMLGSGQTADEFVRDWRADFRSALVGLPAHFREVACKSFDLEADPWVTQSINDPELTPA